MATTTSTSRPSFAEAPSIDGVDLSGSGTVRWCFTGRAQGDLSESAPDGVARLGTRLGVPIFTVHQVHGDGVDVVTQADVTRGGRPVSPVEADGLVTALAGVGLSVRTADCAPVLMWSPEGILGAAHAGWGGLEAGIVGAVAQSMTACGATSIRAVLGPCIGPECYEFGAEPLARLADRFGPQVRARTDEGAEALDLRAAVVAAADAAGVSTEASTPPCTACGGAHYSHRARAEQARQLSVIWRES